MKTIKSVLPKAGMIFLIFRRNRSPDWFYRQGDTGDGTAVCSCDGTGVLP